MDFIKRIYERSPEYPLSVGGNHDAADRFDELYLRIARSEVFSSAERRTAEMSPGRSR